MNTFFLQPLRLTGASYTGARYDLQQKEEILCSGFLCAVPLDLLSLSAAPSYLRLCQPTKADITTAGMAIITMAGITVITIVVAGGITVGVIAAGGGKDCRMGISLCCWFAQQLFVSRLSPAPSGAFCLRGLQPRFWELAHHLRVLRIGPMPRRQIYGQHNVAHHPHSSSLVVWRRLVRPWTLVLS